MFAIEVKNDEVEIWGPYETEELAKQVAESFIINEDTWTVIPVTKEMKFSGRPE